MRSGVSGAGRAAEGLPPQPAMRLLSRALRAARGCRAAAPPPRGPQSAPVGGGAAGQCRGLSSRPGIGELLAAPALRRLLEARERAGAGAELAARIRRLRDKEQELRDTRELARQGAGRGGKAQCVRVCA